MAEGNSTESKSNTDVDADAAETHNLSEMFDTGFGMYNDLNKSNEPTNSPKIQSNVRGLIKTFENCTKLVSLVDMFSKNETFEEVPTENIKFFLLPALLGTLTTKICDSDDRTHIVDVTEIYFVDFLKRLKDYEIINIDIPKIEKNENENEEERSTAITRQKSNSELITEMVYARNTKIQRYQEQKELEKKLQVLKENLDNPNIDDENKREYFVTLLKIYANQAIEELSSIAAERPILEHMKKMSHPDKSIKKPIPSAKLKPIIITRDALQKKVYGAGYPSLPIMTVEEFYDKKVKEEGWPDPSKKNTNATTSFQDIALGKVDGNVVKDFEDEEKERQVEADDPESIERARAMDEYKDDHRRGWGNRANRS